MENWQFLIKIVNSIINLGRDNIIRNEQMQVQNEASVSEVFALLSWSSEGYNFS